MSILYHLYEKVASVYYYGFLLPRFVRWSFFQITWR
jgi:hypothetical protein